MDELERTLRRSPQHHARLGGSGLQDYFPAPPAERLFTWEQAVRVLRKNTRFAAFMVLVFAVPIIVAALLTKNVYQPVARLEIDPTSSGIRSTQDIEQGRVPDSQEYLDTQAEILRSDGLGISVIRELHLETNPEFVSKEDLAGFGRSPEKPTGEEQLRGDVAPYKDQLNLADRTPLQSLALEAFHKRLGVSPVRNSRLIEVSFASHDAKLAKLITNTLVTQFIDQNYRHRYTTTMQASEWLSSQLYDLRQGVEDANQAVAEYQKKYGLVETDEHDVPLAQLMSEVNHQLSEAQANRIEAEAYVRMIDLGQSESLPVVRDDTVYQNLVTRHADVKAQIAQARTIYGDENSNVKRLENEANELGAQVDAERVRMVNRVRTSYAASRDREELMLSAREKLKAQMGDATSHMVAYRVLKAEAMAKAELYNTLQGRLKEAGIFAGLRSSNINVVDFAAELPKPTGPHRPLIITAGVFVSLMVAVALAFVKESLSNTVRTPDDVKDWTGLPSLGMLPRFGGRQAPGEVCLSLGSKPRALLESPANAFAIPRIRITTPETAEAEAMRELRATLVTTKNGTAPSVIIVCSSSANEGKTTVATNLAIELADCGKTCLVESDLRRPKFASTLGAPPKTGLNQVLSGEKSLESVLVDISGIPNLSVLPCGSSTTKSLGQIQSEQMKAMLMALRDRYEYVVIDTPPLIPFSDARVLSAQADAVILVGRYGLTTRRALARGVEILEEAGAPIAGVLLNDINLASPDYHYYNYGFSRAYGTVDYYKDREIEAFASVPNGGPPKKRGAHA